MEIEEKHPELLHSNEPLFQPPEDAAKLTPEMAEGLCMILNGQGTMKGIGKILSGIAGAVQNIGGLMNSI